MIQRIQTIYLAVAAILLMVPSLFSLSFATAGDFELNAVAIRSLNVEQLQEGVNAFPIAGAMALALLLTVYAIMQFKNRKFQIKLVQAALLVQLAIGGLIFLYADKMAALANSTEVSYSPVLAILLINLALYFLAARGIKKDDELVRSADRLR